jgi:lactobin A/cerein 7B family class IIb bacteriocin
MENFIELSDIEKIETEGGILPIIALPLLWKGVCIGFAAGAAIYGAYELGVAIGNN